jgi:glycosyltransferase involved in cell wall biosynthesis
MIKISFIIGTLEAGGAEQHLLTLLSRLDRKIFSCDLCALRSGRMKNDFLKTGVPLTIIGKSKKIDILCLIRLIHYLIRTKPDILHTFMFTSNTWGRIAGIGAKVPVIIAAERSLDLWKKPFHFFIDRMLGKKTDHILCVSEDVRRFYKTKLRLPAEKFSMIPNGIDIDTCDNIIPADLKKEFQRKGPFVLCGTRLSPEKGVEYLIQAAPFLIERLPDIQIIIAGEGGERRRLQELVEKKGLSGTVLLAGFRKDLPNLLAGADIAVLPSLFEGMPHFLLEAMALEKPIAATNVGGSREIVHQGKNGLLSPPRNPRALADNILRILTNPQLSREMGREGKAIVTQYYHLNHIIKRYESLYQKAIAKKRLPLADSIPSSE